MWPQIILVLFYKLLCIQVSVITMWSNICSVMYSLKKSCAGGFLGRGKSILSSPVHFIFLGKMDLLDKFYSTATEELFADCVLIQLFSKCLGVTPQSLLCFVYDLHELSLHSRVLFILSKTCWNSPKIFLLRHLQDQSLYQISFLLFFCVLLQVVFLHLLSNPYLAVIRAEYVILV